VEYAKSMAGYRFSRMVADADQRKGAFDKLVAALEEVGITTTRSYGDRGVHLIEEATAQIAHVSRVSKKLSDLSVLASQLGIHLSSLERHAVPDLDMLAERWNSGD